MFPPATEHGSLVDANTRLTSGAGRVVLRVPAERFEALFEEMLALGKVLSRAVRADVSPNKCLLPVPVLGDWFSRNPVLGFSRYRLWPPNRVLI